MRLRHYVCPYCGTPVGNREVAMERLQAWMEKKATDQAAVDRIEARLGQLGTPTIICSKCERRVPLWDEMEQIFASPDTQQLVRELQKQSAIVLDNESKEGTRAGGRMILHGGARWADQPGVRRKRPRHRHGDRVQGRRRRGRGRKLYLQLKSGDSYLRQRRRREAEVFTIKDERHARYWMTQKFPVMLLIRSSEGEVRWMEVRDWLKLAKDKGQKPVKQIVFKGERFDVMSVRRWRDKVLGQDLPTDPKARI